MGRFPQFTHPRPCHVSGAVKELRSRIAKVDLVFSDNGRVCWAGLVMNNGTVWSGRRDSVERQPLEMLKLPARRNEDIVVGIASRYSRSVFFQLVCRLTFGKYDVVFELFFKPGKVLSQSSAVTNVRFSES